MKVFLNPVTMIAIYLTIWWIVLFAILPLGSRSHAEEGLELKDGGDPGAPVRPNLKRKAITTSWVAAIVFAVIYAVLFSGLFHLPELSGR
jgi:predicted secreted protein